jgi:hypothetical protein
VAIFRFLLPSFRAFTPLEVQLVIAHPQLVIAHPLSWLGLAIPPVGRGAERLRAAVAGMDRRTGHVVAGDRPRRGRPVLGEPARGQVPQCAPGRHPPRSPVPVARTRPPPRLTGLLTVALGAVCAVFRLTWAPHYRMAP